MIEYNNYKYVIEGTTVKAWAPSAPEDSDPFLLQPHDPLTGKTFSSPEEAEQWIIDYLKDK